MGHFGTSGLGGGIGCDGTHPGVLKLENLFQGNCAPFWYIGPGRRVRDLDRDGIPARVMVTGGHARWEGRGVSGPIQDAIALRLRAYVDPLTNSALYT